MTQIRLVGNIRHGTGRDVHLRMTQKCGAHRIRRQATGFGELGSGR